MLDAYTRPQISLPEVECNFLFSILTSQIGHEELLRKLKSNQSSLRTSGFFFVREFCTPLNCSGTMVVCPTLALLSLWRARALSRLHAGARAPRGGVTRQGVVLTDLQSLLDCQIIFSSLFPLGQERLHQRACVNTRKSCFGLLSRKARKNVGNTLAHLPSHRHCHQRSRSHKQSGRGHFADTACVFSLLLA